MKRKIVAICVIAAMAAIAIVGASFAYFSDVESAKNTFTYGNIDIDLQEKQADLETDYVETELMPGSSTVNTVAKRAWIENTGSNAAWVWGEILIPAALDNPQDASQNALHINTYGQLTTNYHSADWSSSYANTPMNDGLLDADHNPLIEGMVTVEEDHLWTECGFQEVRTVDGIEYNVYLFKMNTMLEPGEKSFPFLRQVYMDSKVKQSTITEDGATEAVPCLLLPNGEKYTGTWEIIVNGYAIQDADFADIDAAIAAFASDYEG